MSSDVDAEVSTAGSGFNISAGDLDPWEFLVIILTIVIVAFMLFDYGFNSGEMVEYIITNILAINLF